MNTRVSQTGCHGDLLKLGAELQAISYFYRWKKNEEIVTHDEEAVNIGISSILSRIAMEIEVVARSLEKLGTHTSSD